MYLYELLNSDIDFQSKWKVVEFDYDEYERIELNPADAMNKKINYLYVEDDVLYIEVESDTEIPRF